LQYRGAALATSSDNPDSRIEKILMERRMLKKSNYETELSRVRLS